MNDIASVVDLEGNLKAIQNLLKTRLEAQTPEGSLVDLGSHFRDEYKKKVGIISWGVQGTDRQDLRVIRERADSSVLPMVIVENQGDLEDALETFKDCELVLIWNAL